MTHKFIVNTEAVNSYGYRVITAGIETTQYMRNPVLLYMHDRYNKEDRGSEVIGRCVGLTVENDTLIAEVEFDMQDEFAAKIAGKVERGFIRMCSLYADIVESSMDPAVILPGQYLETVTKCKMVELSIADIGGLDDALKLSRGETTVKLNKLNPVIKNNQNDMEFKTIALALNMDAGSTETAVLGEIQKLRLAKDTAESKQKELEKQVGDHLMEEAEGLVNKAVELGLIPDALKAVQLSAFKNDHQANKVALTALIIDKEKESKKDDKTKVVKNFLNVNKTVSNSGGSDEVSFIKLSKENPQELIRLRNEDPEEYNRLLTTTPTR